MMGFERAIEHGKTRRKAYRGGKAVDPSCRNHGDCPWCQGNRTHHNKVREISAEEKMKELEIR